jgi:hypothetical protein
MIVKTSPQPSVTFYNISGMSIRNLDEDATIGRQGGNDRREERQWLVHMLQGVEEGYGIKGSLVIRQPSAGIGLLYVRGEVTRGVSSPRTGLEAHDVEASACRESDELSGGRTDLQ